MTPEWVARLLPRVGGADRYVDGSDLLDRVPRLTAIVCVAYRLVASTSIMLPWAWSPGVRRDLLVGILAISALVHALTLWYAWRLVRRGRDWPWLVLCGDTLLATSVYLGFREVADPPYQHLAGWVAITGTVATWTAVRGVLPGMLVGVASTALLVWGDSPDRWTGSVLIAAAGQCLAAVMVVGAFVSVLRHGLDLSGHEARSSERERTNRLLHDTTVQTLEAINLTATTSVGSPSQRLDRIASMARCEARRLRGSWSSRGRAPSLHAGLREAIEAARRGGTAIADVTEPVAAVAMSVEEVDSIVGAVHEALSNVSKHAGVPDATVSAMAADAAVVVSVIDRGRGFEVDSTIEGFGISQSIRARIGELGGEVTIESAPGRGTSVVLTVPRRAPMSLGFVPGTSGSNLPTNA
ncbi:MAG: ATP-binding protein [Nocardioides sp.]